MASGPSLYLPKMPHKILIRHAVASPLRRLVAVFSTVRSFLTKMLKTRSFNSRNRPLHFFIYFTRNKKNKIHCGGSFRLHYNWCSSRSWSVPKTTVMTDVTGPDQVYYDSTLQCGEVVGVELYSEPSELSGYLQWLEEKKVAGNGEEASGGGQLPPPPRRNEIDELADVFIAQCREKFILEKQESDRRFHDMLARSM